VTAWREPTQSAAREDASLRAFAAVDDNVTAPDNLFITPLPATGWMMLAGLSALVAARRRLTRRAGLD
jgi:hypothetical protein